MVTVLLGYIDRFTASKIIMLVTFHYAVITVTCMKATVVKRISAYSFHLETNESLSLGRVLK